MKINKLNLVYSIIAGILFLGTTSCQRAINRTIEASGSVYQSHKNCQNFNSLRVANNLKVKLVMGHEEKVTIEAAESIQPYIQAYVRERELIIRVEPGYKFCYDHNGGKEPVITVYAKNIKDIDLTGSSSLEFENINSRDLEIELSGNSYVYGTVDAISLSVDLSGSSQADLSISADRASFDLSGASHANLTGVANYVEMDLSGSSELGDYIFSMNYLDAELSGSSEVQCTVEKEIRVEASGGSILSYKGNAMVTLQKLSGGSEVRKIR